MDTVVTAVRNLFGLVTGARPQFRSQGGSTAENLALQNIQVKVCRFHGSTSYPSVLIGKAPNGSFIYVRTTFALGPGQKWGLAGPRKCKC